MALGNETRVPENPGNPPIFKPVNPGLCVLKNPGLAGLVSGVSTTRRARKSVQKFFLGLLGLLVIPVQCAAIIARASNLAIKDN